MAATATQLHPSVESTRTDEAPDSGVLDRLASALRAERRCGEHGHPLAAGGECPCGAIRYD